MLKPICCNNAKEIKWPFAGWEQFFHSWEIFYGFFSILRQNLESFAAFLHQVYTDLENEAENKRLIFSRFLKSWGCYWVVLFLENLSCENFIKLMKNWQKQIYHFFFILNFMLHLQDGMNFWYWNLQNNTSQRINCSFKMRIFIWISWKKFRMRRIWDF